MIFSSNKTTIRNNEELQIRLHVYIQHSNTISSSVPWPIDCFGINIVEDHVQIGTSLVSQSYTYLKGK